MILLRGLILAAPYFGSSFVDTLIVCFTGYFQLIFELEFFEILPNLNVTHMYSLKCAKSNCFVCSKSQAGESMVQQCSVDWMGMCTALHPTTNWN